MNKRMAGDYEIIQSFHIGDQEVVLGENVNAPPGGALYVRFLPAE